MRNAILTFVYKVLPEDQKNAEVALSQLEDEQKADDKKAAEEAGVAAEKPSDGAEKPVTENEESSFNIEIPTAIDPDFLSKDSLNSSVEA